MKNGVAVYGGFTGDEPPGPESIQARDLTTHTTILDAGTARKGEAAYHAP